VTSPPTQHKPCRETGCRSLAGNSGLQPVFFSRPRLPRWLGAALLVLALACLGGCVTLKPPAEFFELTPESPANKAMQTRFFETGNERELLSAAAAVLQDLGFQVEDVERDIGLLKAVKERSAREHGQDISRFLVGLVTFCYVRLTTDFHQKISAVLVARPVDRSGRRSEVRVTFYRVVWESDGYVERTAIPPGEQRMEIIDAPFIYQQFFAKLSKSVFLEAFTL